MRSPLFFAIITVVAAYFSKLLALAVLAVPFVGPFLAPAILIAVEAASYPLTLFVTFIHESGHAVAAVLTGGKVTGMGVALDGSGLTSVMTNGFWSNFVVTNAGYLAGVLYGTFVLFFSNRFGNSAWTLRATGTAISVCTLLFAVFAHGPVSPGLGIEMRFLATALGAVFATACFVAANRVKSPFLLDYFVGLLAVSCVFRAIGDIWNVFIISSGNLADNDASALGELTGIPGPAWAVAWAALSVFLIWKAFSNLGRKGKGI